MKNLLLATVIYLLLVGAVVVWYLWGERKSEEPKQPDRLSELVVPSPALGRTVATAIHQAVTDPYFVPLERLNWFLTKNPQSEEISLDMLTKWAPDDEFPTCFVWSRDKVRGAWRIDQPESPWVIEVAQGMIVEGLRQPNPQGRMQIGQFTSDGKKYWIGYMRIPLTSSNPRQVAGVLFSMDDYLDKAVPRWLNHLTQRARFPIVKFQADYPPIRGEEEGDISFLIRDDNKEVYYQQGRNFEPEKLIYSESVYYPEPIVCMQEGWDIEVYSLEKVVPPPEPKGVKRELLRLLLLLLLLTVIHWGGWWVRRRLDVR